MRSRLFSRFSRVRLTFSRGSRWLRLKKPPRAHWKRRMLLRALRRVDPR